MDVAPCVADISNPQADTLSSLTISYLSGLERL